MKLKTPILVLISFTVGLVVMFILQSSPQFGLQQRSIIRESCMSLRSQVGHGSSRYGKIIRGKEHKILYNSVPKCGSRTFRSLSMKVFKEDAIQVTVDTLRSPASFENIKNYEASYVKNLVTKTAPPSYFQGHGPFLPFDKKPRPVYINFVRDPVSRMVSAFYFALNGDNRPNRTTPLVSETLLNKTIEECILERMAMCTKPGKYPEIFCGFDPRCRNNFTWAFEKAKSNIDMFRNSISEFQNNVYNISFDNCRSIWSNLTWALDRAKSNIDKYYTFIGITEEYETSLRVLEHLMPDLYSGATKIYLSLLNTTSSIELSKTKDKKELSQKLIASVTEILAVDYELYNYIYEKHRALKLKFNIV